MEDRSREVHVDKMYRRTHRDKGQVDDATLKAARALVREPGEQVADEITASKPSP